MESPESKPSFYQLVKNGEPFRLLFPVGLAIGIFGVLLWPAYAWKLISFYPGLVHSRIMVEGFMTAFIMGFLGTSLPRLLSAPQMKGAGSVACATSLGILVFLHAGQLHVAGDAVFVATLSGFIVWLLGRFLEREDTPPPAFVLLAGGLSCGLGGAVLLLAAHIYPGTLGHVSYTLARLLLNQGFILLPVMGVGSFFLPRIFSLPNRQDFPESRTAPPGWYSKAIFSAACGLLVLASFFLETYGFLRIGFVLRGGTFLVYFLREVPAYKSPGKTGSMATVIRIALLAIPLGYFFIAFLPVYQAALLHIIFITGFCMLIFTVASRVILGHSGQSRFFMGTLVSIRVMATFMVLSMMVRTTADWMPTVRFSHYGYAALLWILGSLVWGWGILPSVSKPDEED